jgi:hypothetical protein
MAEAKIEIKVGAVSFSGEGDGKWVSDQLDKMLEKLPALARVAPHEGDGGDHAKGAGGAGGAHVNKAKGTLANFLKEKGATTKQVRKFLATAVWLHDRNGKDRLSATEVVKALSDNSQKRLGNAPDCLNQNVAKGFCEKDNKEFFVTDDGRAELG